MIKNSKGYAFVLLASMLFFTQACLSQVSPLTPAQQTDHAISDSGKWLALLHYRPQGLMNRVFSEVDDEKFFLAKNGKYDSHAELMATLSALQITPVAEDADDSAHCRFPARKHFVKSVYPNISLPDVKCNIYEKWSDQIGGTDLFLIFPSSYMNSPSSMYGHTLMRLDGKAKGERRGHKLLSSAINFAAYTDHTDDELTYSVKGLTGGYPGYVSLVPYFQKVKEYSHMESRDIWEYKLDLSQAQIDEFVRHIWELDKIRFDYFFVDENCSYRLLTILDAVNPQWNLSQQFKYRTVPSDTIRVLLNKNLITNVEYRPSKTSTIAHHRSELPERLRDISRALADDPFTAEKNSEFIALAALDKAQVLELAYDYTRYKAFIKKQDKPKDSFKLLALRANVDYQGQTFSPVPVPSVRDEEGHSTLRSKLGVDEDGSLLGFRINYHDWLDQLPGYRQGAQIEMGEFTFRLSDDIQLEQLDVVSIRSLGARNQFSQPISWQVNVGYAHGLDDVSEYQVRLAGGLSYDFLGGMVYGMAVGDLKQSQRFKHNWLLAAGPEVGYLYQATDVSAWLALEHMESESMFGQEDRAKSKLSVAMAYHINARSQLRVNYQQQARDLNTLGFSGSNDNQQDQVRVDFVWYH